MLYNLLMPEEYQYLNLIKEILQKGVKKVDQGTGDISYSLFGRQIRFDLSNNSFPLLTTKKVYWKGVLYELYWFLSGQSNIRYLVLNNVHIWDDYPYRIYKMKNEQSKMSKEEFVEKIKIDETFAKKWGELPKIYGELWRRWPTRYGKTIDQLAWAIEEIKKDPNAHNALVTSWNPEYLYTMARYQDTSHFPICHNLFQLNVNNGHLSLQLYQRSADIFLGVPFNIASYALLTLIIAQITGYKPGEFVHTFGDVHLYENHINQAKEQLKRKPYPFPKIKFTKKFKNLDEFQPKIVQLLDYQYHPPLKAPLSVSGGYLGKKKNIHRIKCHYHKS